MADSERGDDSGDLIEYIAKAIVSEPDEVHVVIDDDGDLIELETADGDRGRVIGRQGRVEGASRHPERNGGRCRRPARYCRLTSDASTNLDQHRITSNSVDQDAGQIGESDGRRNVGFGSSRSRKNHSR